MAGHNGARVLIIVGTRAHRVALEGRGLRSVAGEPVGIIFMKPGRVTGKQVSFLKSGENLRCLPFKPNLPVGKFFANGT